MANISFQLEPLLPRHTRKIISLRSGRLGYTDQANTSPRLALDRNENHLGSVGATSEYYKYPDNQCLNLRKELLELHQNTGLGLEHITIGNGVTELMDVVMRAFLQPERDSVLLFSPYECLWKEMVVLNGGMAQEIPLNSFFQLPLNKAKKEIGDQTKVIVIQHPNALLGTALRQYDILDLLDSFNGIVVVDETYIDFAEETSLLPLLKDYPNMIILQSFSKAWGLAALRVGVAYASKEISEVLRAVKAPFSVSTPAQEQAVKALHLPEKKRQWVAQLQTERERVAAALQRLPFVTKVSPSVANFLLVAFDDHKKTFEYLQNERIDVVLCGSQQAHCEQSLRIAIGDPIENDRLLLLLREMPNRLSPLRRFLRGFTSTFGKVGMVLGVVKKIFG